MVERPCSPSCALLWLWSLAGESWCWAGGRILPRTHLCPAGETRAVRQFHSSRGAPRDTCAAPLKMLCNKALRVTAFNRFYFGTYWIITSPTQSELGIYRSSCPANRHVLCFLLFCVIKENFGICIMLPINYKTFNYIYTIIFIYILFLYVIIYTYNPKQIIKLSIS